MNTNIKNTCKLNSREHKKIRHHSQVPSQRYKKMGQKYKHNPLHRPKVRNHMAISLDEEKAKIQHLS